MSNTELLKRLRWATTHLRWAVNELRAVARKEVKDDKSKISQFVKWDFKYKGAQ